MGADFYTVVMLRLFACIGYFIVVSADAEVDGRYDIHGNDLGPLKVGLVRKCYPEFCFDTPWEPSTTSPPKPAQWTENIAVYLFCFTLCLPVLCGLLLLAILLAEAPYWNITTLFGWKNSSDCAKIDAYLKFKRIEYKYEAPSIFSICLFPRRVDNRVMPIVKTDKDYVQDCKEIIQHFEAKYKRYPLIPSTSTPKRRFVSNLIEAWVDQFWSPITTHFRWTHPENFEFYEIETGKNLLPGFPRFLQKRAASTILKVQRDNLASQGVCPEQGRIIEEWTTKMLSQLNDHFQVVPYTLGNEATIADIALAGPLCANLGRDPWSKQNLVSHLPHLVKWIERIEAKDDRERGNGRTQADDDNIPESLLPIIDVIFREFTPFVFETLRVTSDFAETRSRRTLLPLTLGDISYPMGTNMFTRNATPFTLYRVDTILNDLKRLRWRDQQVVTGWLLDRGVVAAEWIIMSESMPVLDRSEWNMMRVCVYPYARSDVCTGKPKSKKYKKNKN